MCVRYVIAFWPIYFKCSMLISSGSVDLFVFSLLHCLFCVLFKTVACVFCSFFIFFFLSMTLLACVVEYFVVL